VKLAIYEVMQRKPDLLVSGINHGANTSTNVLYSGTMSAAVEGAMEEIPSIGFSLCDFNANADFSEAKEIVEKVVEKVLSESLPKGVCLNVNIPKKGEEKYKGIQVCHQAYAFWADKFDKRLDQFGNPYYWLTGSFGNENNEQGTDLWAIEQGYATIVPTQFDMTAYQALEKMKNWNL
jgi:5'-nucleotidase